MPPTPDPSPPRLPAPSAGPKAAPSSSSAYHTSIADTFFDWWCAMAAGRSPLVVSLIVMTALHQRAHGRSSVLAGPVALSSTPASASGRCVLHVHAPASVFLAGTTTSSTTSPWAANADELPYAGLGLPGFFAAATGVVLSDVDAGGCAGQSLSAPSSILYRAMAPIFSPCATFDPPPPPVARTGHLLVSDWALCSRSSHPPQRRDRAHRRPWPCSYGHNPPAFMPPFPCRVRIFLHADPLL